MSKMIIAQFDDPRVSPGDVGDVQVHSKAVRAYEMRQPELFTKRIQGCLGRSGSGCTGRRAYEGADLE